MAKEPAQPRILVVDDAQDVLVAVGAFLTREGCLVVKASDGEEALRLIASDPLISLLVTDFIMPGLSMVPISSLKPWNSALIFRPWLSRGIRKPTA